MTGQVHTLLLLADLARLNTDVVPLAMRAHITTSGAKTSTLPRFGTLAAVIRSKSRMVIRSMHTASPPGSPKRGRPSSTDASSGRRPAGTPPPGGHPPARLYLAGTPAVSRRVADLFTASLAAPVLLGEHLGQASALKMAFACFQRPSRIAAALAHALADDHGLTEALLAEAQRMPRDILTDRDFLPSVAARAWRWAPELHEVATTLGARQLPTDLALATADVLQHWADTTTDHPTDLASILRQLHLPPQ